MLGCVIMRGLWRCWRQLCPSPQQLGVVAGEGSYVWTLPFGLVGNDPDNDVGDLENTTARKHSKSGTV